MISCRISKYDPQYRGPDGVYKKNEWTSICDIGGVFDDGVLTRDEYLATESRYIGVFRDILEELNIKMLCLSDFEVCNNIPEIRQYKRNKVLNVDASCLFLTNCLRENCWGRLKSKRAKWFNAYVGYDYYLHINAIGDYCAILGIVAKYGLFCEWTGSEKEPPCLSSGSGL